jgi:pimeloyl-ACP methyl ester carboxylesterase
MYVERYGDGKKIYIALHGWGGDRRTFAPIAAFVPAEATVYSADLPGVGLSPAPRVWSVDEIVDEIVSTVSAYGNPRATIVGHCGGAVFGLLAAVKAEKLIEKVVMIDPFAYLPRYFKIFLNRAIGDRAYHATFANPLGRWVTNQALRGRRQGETDLTAAFAAINHETARRYLALFAEMESFKIPADFRLDVDLIYGQNSFGAVKKSVAVFKNLLPQARVRQLSGASHLPIEESTGELCQAIFELEKSADSSEKPGIVNR